MPLLLSDRQGMFGSSIKVVAELNAISARERVLLSLRSKPNGDVSVERTERNLRRSLRFYNQHMDFGDKPNSKTQSLPLSPH